MGAYRMWLLFSMVEDVPCLMFPGLRQRSLVFSRSSSICSWRVATSLSIILGNSMFMADFISPRIGAMQLPVIWVQLFSVAFLMNFMTSMLKPQVLIHILNLECSVLMFSMRPRNMESTLSLRQWNSGERRFGLSQTSDSTSSQRALEQLSWKRLHSSLLQKPASQIMPGLRQVGLVQTAKQGLPQTHSGPWNLLCAILNNMNIQ